MKRYIKSTEEQTYNPEYYYQIMNMLDDIALAGRFPTKSEKQQLDELLAKDGDTIEDIAEANDCYNTDDELCHTWDEMISALHILFEHGERVPIDPEDEEDEEDDYDPKSYGQHSEEWYIARDHGDDTDPF